MALSQGLSAALGFSGPARGDTDLGIIEVISRSA